MPSKISSGPHTATVLLFVSVIVPGFAADKQTSAKHARVEYFQDQSTPDGIVYQSFLSSVTYFSAFSRDDAVHRIVDLFKLPHDDTATAIAESLYERFEVSYDNLINEIKAMEVRTICPPSRKTRTKEEVYTSFHKAADNREEISAKYLEKILKELTNEEQQKLIDHLANAKEAFYYVKTDYAAKYAEIPGIDVRDDVETICSNLGVNTQEK